MLFMACNEGKGTLVRLRDKTTHRSYTVAPTHRYGTTFCPADNVVVAFQSRSSAFFFAPSTQQPAHRSFTPEQVTGCAVSSCGTFLVCGSQNGSILAWNLKTGQLLKTFRGHLRCITSVSFSADNSLVVSASEDSVCKVWSLASLTSLVPSSTEVQPVSTFTGHTLAVLCCVFLHHSHTVVSGSGDKTCRVFDAATAEQLASFTVGDAVTAIAVSDDDAVLAVGTQTGFLCFHQLTAPRQGAAHAGDIDTERRARFLPPSEDGHNSPLVFLKFVAETSAAGGSAGGSSSSIGDAAITAMTGLPATVLTASEGGAVLWYDATSCQLIGEAFPRQKQKIFSCTYFPDIGVSGERSVTLPGLSKNPMDPTEKAAYAVERLAKRPRKESHSALVAQVKMNKASQEQSDDAAVDEALEKVLAETAELEGLRAKMIKKLAKIQRAR